MGLDPAVVDFAEILTVDIADADAVAAVFARLDMVKSELCPRTFHFLKA